MESKVTLLGSTVLPGFSPPVLAEIEGNESERGRRQKNIPGDTVGQTRPPPDWL